MISKTFFLNFFLSRIFLHKFSSKNAPSKDIEKTDQSQNLVRQKTVVTFFERDNGTEKVWTQVDNDINIAIQDLENDGCMVTKICETNYIGEAKDLTDRYHYISAFTTTVIFYNEPNKKDK